MNSTKEKILEIIRKANRLEKERQSNIRTKTSAISELEKVIERLCKDENSNN